MHGINQNESFSYSTLPQALFYLGSNVDEGPAGGHFKPEFFTITFHHHTIPSVFMLEFAAYLARHGGRCQGKHCPVVL
jgi:hypothetical protein